LKTLILEGTSVKAYMLDPTTAAEIGSNRQADKIYKRWVFLPDELRASAGQEEGEKLLEAFKYRAPASISAVRIGRDLIALGWYVYVPWGPKGDRVSIFAHNKPGIVVRKRHKAFAMLSDFLDDLIINSKPVPVPLPLEADTEEEPLARGGR
jgi:hypothetical protein